MATPRIAASARQSAAETTRSLIVAALDELAVPSRIRLITDYVAARWDTTLDSRTIGDVRRGERRRCDRNQGDNGPYVAPALEAVWFQPITRTLTLLEWPLERRIIGPWSERTDHLEATIRIARQHSATPNPALQALTVRMARTIPGALTDQPWDGGRVIDAAEAALADIAPRDRTWRAHTADHAAHTLTAAQQRWGATDLPEDDADG
jgi:hypothetical protein